MPDTVLTAAGVFPVGTSIAAYKAVEAQGFARRGEAPVGLTAVETETVADDEVTFADLTAGHPYLVYGKAGATESTVDVENAGGVGEDEIDVVTIRGFNGRSLTGGTWTLTVEVDGGTGAATTVALAHDASWADVQYALEELDDLAPGDVVVTGDNGGPYTLTFGGDVTETEITTTVDASNLTGATEHRYVQISGSPA